MTLWWGGACALTAVYVHALASLASALLSVKMSSHAVALSRSVPVTAAQALWSVPLPLATVSAQVAADVAAVTSNLSETPPVQIPLRWGVADCVCSLSLTGS